MKVTAEMMDGVFGGKGGTPKSFRAYQELQKACSKEIDISDEAWLAIPNDARSKLMSVYFCAVNEAFARRMAGNVEYETTTETGK